MEITESAIKRGVVNDLTHSGDVLSAASGDRIAYSRLVASYRSVICSIALTITRDIEASEEVAQEVFLAAWRDLARLRNPASLLPWLRQMARHKARDHIRSVVLRRRTQLSQIETERAIEEAIAPNSDHGETLLDAEARSVLQAAIDELPEDSREVITLFYREGQSGEQVARLLGIREDAVKKRLSRARESLRAAMLDRFGDMVVRTAPGLAFSDRVMGAIAPTLPAATTTAAAKVASGIGAKLLWMIGPVLGLIAQVFWTKREMARAIDETERDQLRSFGITYAIVINSWVAFLIVSLITSVGERLVPFVAGSWVMAIIWLREVRYEGIISRRCALERKRDPSAAARQRRDQMLRWIWYPIVVGGTYALVLTR
jgi:RNA polymerase sigma factor (sigma-70 family)